MNKRICSICGCEYEPRQRNQVTCGDPDCRRIQHLEYMRKYGKAHRKEHREYNRAWMAKKRAEEAEKAEEKDTIIGLGYAERQRQKTLELVGGIQI